MANQTIPGLQWLSKQIEQLDADLLRQMLKAITEFLMGLEADQRCGAEFGQKSKDRNSFVDRLGTLLKDTQTFCFAWGPFTESRALIGTNGSNTNSYSDETFAYK